MADGQDHAAFDAQWWEEHYREAEPGDGPASPLLAEELEDLPTGTALDAGCGTGAHAIWLAEKGWEVTALDVSATAIGHAERRAREGNPEAAARITWGVADLTTWQAPRPYDLVVSLYVHPGVPFPEFVARLTRAVAPGGTLLVAGHDHDDEHSQAHAPEDSSIGAESVVASLSSAEWEVQVAESRTRQVRRGETELTMRDVVVKARRAS
jgi:2-polyprenyl-3-methyl-5-hydroxy-6-metoxy-1,4-benzoquinol methylase